MSHFPMPVLDQSKIDLYTALFRGDKTVAQPEAASFEYLIAMQNMWRAGEFTFNVSLVAIEKMPPDVLDFFIHKDFNSGNFDRPEVAGTFDQQPVELVGVAVWEAM